MKSSTSVLALLLVVLVVTLATSAAAQQASRPTPKLIVAVSVDQFSADLFAEYRQLFTGGLGRLSREGVVFPSGYQSHAATETCPGHSTILTGAHPDRTGIIANNWFDLAVRKDKPIYCAEDETAKDYTISAVHLRVPTLGERMETADSATRSVSVAGKDRAAVMMGGHKVDQLWWWDGKTFVGPASQTSAAADQIKMDVAAEIAAPRAALDLPASCAARDHAVSVGGSKTVGTGHFARPAGDARAFRASPDFDRAILALAAALAAEMRLDEGTATNILAIGLSATDYVGHTYGTEGAEMCLQLLALDRELGSFFAKLDATGVDYVVVLTADHGGHDLPERHQEHAAATAVRVEPGLEVATMSKKIATQLKLKEPVLYGEGPSGDIYVDKAFSAKTKAKVLAYAKKLYQADRQVAVALTRAEVQAVPRPTGPPESWSLAERARASFDPQRSGDLVVLLKPRVTPITEKTAAMDKEYVATHGSPWDYDRRVPILFWRKGMTPFEQPLSVETVDIAPTLAAIVSVPTPQVDGKCLISVATACR
jgi:predicted AlkP superfamily pyrophosphatase or phosphodiesterase